MMHLKIFFTGHTGIRYIFISLKKKLKDIFFIIIIIIIFVLLFFIIILNYIFKEAFSSLYYGYIGMRTL